MGFIKFSLLLTVLILFIWIFDEIISMFPEKNRIKKWWRRNVVGELKDPE